jgi:ethanolamine ammonia-lyase small subunit
MSEDSWSHLKAFTAARIALGRSTASIPTRERLDFQLSHARALDAVLTPFLPEELAAELKHLPTPSLVIESRDPNRSTYLRRPDLGRRLSDHSREALEALRPEGPWDLVILISDGLSTTAAMRQSRPLLDHLLPKFLDAGWRVAPLLVTLHARVAVQDEAGARWMPPSA